MLQPKELLAQPHLLAHALRTPLTVIAGYAQMLEDGDIASKRLKKVYRMLCIKSAELNEVIDELCDEVRAAVAESPDQLLFVYPPLGEPAIPVEMP